MSFPSIKNPARRLRVYIGESDLWRGRPLIAVLLETLKKEGLAGATVLRGVAGFGAHSRIHTASILDLSTDLPMVVEVIDSPEKIQTALEIISPMVREGLITLEAVEVVMYTHRLLHPLSAEQPVGEVMTRDPVAVRGDQPVFTAWETMMARKLKALPVVDTQDRVIGLITFEDLLERMGLNARLAVALRLDEDSLRAEMEILRSSPRTLVDVMSKPPLTVHPDDPAGLAAERLVRRGVTRLPVVDSSGKLVGMVSRLDLLRQVMDVPEKSPVQPVLGGSGRLAGEVMSAQIPLVKEEADLATVVASFLAHGEHRVVVVDGEGRAVGLISDSDVIGRIQPMHRRGVLGALRGWAKPPDLNVTARELMSPGAETITAGTPVVDAVRRMLSAGRKWLVVVDEAGKPLGLIDREIALEALIH